MREIGVSFKTRKQNKRDNSNNDQAQSLVNGTSPVESSESTDSPQDAQGAFQCKKAWPSNHTQKDVETG